MPGDGLGRPLRLGQIDAPLWDTPQYSLASLVYERALSYRCRTHDPARADLFLVPAYKARLVTDQSCAEKTGSRLNLLRRMQLKLPNSSSALLKAGGQNRGGGNGRAGGGRNASAEWLALPPVTLSNRGGADHIVLNPRSGMTWERYPFCELTMGSHHLGAALHLAMEAHPHNASWVYPEGYCGKVCVPAYRPQLLSEGFYWSVPWTSTVHLDATASATPPWASRHARRTLVAAHFGLLHKPVLPRPTLALRQRLLDACKAAVPSQCKALPPADGLPERTASLYWESTFCLQPGGDTITRKGMVDALLLGCIPVLFHEGQPAQWPWHWGQWVRHATVLLNQSAVREGTLDVIATLAALPAERVGRMQAAIRKHAHRVHYAAVDTTHLPSGLRGWSSPDAFEVILEGAWRVARDARLQQMGRHLQRTRGGGREVRSRQWKLAMAVGSEDDSSGDLDGFVYAGVSDDDRR